MDDREAVSRAYLACMHDGDYYEATRLAKQVLDQFGDFLRHHEMMLTVNVRRANVAAALEDCNELVRYCRAGGRDTAEYEEHRDILLRRLEKTRGMLAHGLWNAVMEDLRTASSRFAAAPLLISGEGHLQANEEAGAFYVVFYVNGDADKRIACQLEPGEIPFLDGVPFPCRVTVHGHFLAASETLILLQPCNFVGTVDILWQ